MILQKNIFWHCICLASLSTSCGKKANSTEEPVTVTATQLVEDSQLTMGVVNASHGDAVAAAADQGASSSARLMMGDDDGVDNGGGHDDSNDDKDSDDDTSNVTKACTASSDGKSVTVTATSSVNRSRTKKSNGGRVTVTSTRTGSGTSTRTWSRADGSAVACTSDNSGVKADFKNPSGLKLEASFDRTRTDSKSYTGPKLTRSSSKTITSSGKRTVTWSSNDTSDDSGTTYTRSKSVLITDTTNSITLSNKDGQNITATLTIRTPTDSPLVVKVERNNSSHAVVSKTFVSGQVVVKKDSDASITTTYSNLKLNFADNSCSIIDGSAQIVVKDSSGATIKTLSLGKNSGGDSSLSDDSGTEVEGFALDDCDSEDIKL